MDDTSISPYTAHVTIVKLTEFAQIDCTHRPAPRSGNTARTPAVPPLVPYTDPSNVTDPFSQNNLFLQLNEISSQIGIL